jgi:tRNA U34 5-methylaminomethyl-2-thiouridine-forming methyltransferase MnmC
VNRQIILTEDGSSTLYIPELNEHYHSIHGAIQESMHVFIEAGLKKCSASEVKIFELGFGTGLNCLLSILNNRGKTIEYHSIEPFPIEPGLVKQLNYPSILKLDLATRLVFESIHNAPWNELVKIKGDFLLRKIKDDMETFSSESKFDIVYFDAFSPAIHPHLWTKEIFSKLFDWMNTGGILVTFCAKGEVRRNMQSCGFAVERLPGPPGKREILRAVKN